MSGDDSRYDVVFLGDVVPGENIADVKQRLATLFNADASRIEQLFSGRPVTVKKHVDQSTAERYQQTLRNAGAVVNLRAVAIDADSSAASEPAVAAQSSDRSGVAKADDSGRDSGESVGDSHASEGSLTLAEVGADVLAPQERRDYQPREVDTSAISLAVAGADLLAEEEKKPVVDRAIDTSHIQLDSD